MKCIENICIIYIILAESECPFNKSDLIQERVEEMPNPDEDVLE